MQISVVSLSKRLADAEVLAVVRAVNRQVQEDFAAHWHLTATLRLEGTAQRLDAKGTPMLLRGDAILYLDDSPHGDGTDGFHQVNGRGIPFGVVHTEIAKEIDGGFSSTFSHEVLELVGNPLLNSVVAGPHPVERRRHVFHWREVCDPVQADTYELDGVAVSNFLLPSYYDASEALPHRRDFLATRGRGGDLPAFGLAKGGYTTFWDPEKHGWVVLDADQEARRRRTLKEQATTRRAARRPALRLAEDAPASKRARERASAPPSAPSSARASAPSKAKR